MIKRKTSQNTATIDNTRILYYDFFGSLFIYDCLLNKEELLLKQIEILKTEPINDIDLEYFNTLENEIKNNGIKNLLFDYTRIFILPFNSEFKKDLGKKNKKYSQISLYLSYYLDGTIAGSGLIKAKEKVRQSKVRLNSKEFKENEEHLGFLFIFTKYLLQNGENKLQNEVFKECINPMKDKIIKEIKKQYEGHLYFNVASLLKSFLDFENALIQK